MEYPETILGIDTSCDDTCVAVVRKGDQVLSNLVSSQNEIHEKFGGIVPELAARKHLENIPHIVKLALKKANLSWEEIEAIAVTNRCGLASSLLVGVAMAKALAYARKLPLIGIHHVEGHIYSNFLQWPDISFPYLSLTVAGGHTFLVLVEKEFNYRPLGHSIDDAVGEAYDKVARYLGLGFPGGPILDRLASENRLPPVFFSSPMLNSGNYLFSFSGIKTAVRYYVDKLSTSERKEQLTAIAAGFQAAVVKVLVNKTIKAAKEYELGSITLSGGVAANSGLRKELEIAATAQKIKLYCPDIAYCTDNAAMIAGLAYHKMRRGESGDFTLDAQPDAFHQLVSNKPKELSHV